MIYQKDPSSTAIASKMSAILPGLRAGVQDSPVTGMGSRRRQKITTEKMEGID
jgi:hypothetical protein